VPEEEIAKLGMAKSKTDPVGKALRTQLAQARHTVPVNKRLVRSMVVADAMGPSDTEFDMKAYTDGMWGDT